MPKLPQLRAIRESRMLSQEMLAERASVTQATVSRIENGQGAQYETVRKLARVLRVKATDLVGIA